MGAICNTTSSIANAHSAIDELNAIPKLIHAIGAQRTPFSAPEEMTDSKRRDICKWVRRKLGLWPRGMWRVFPLFLVESFENCRLVGVSVGSSVGLFVDSVGIWISSSWVELYGDCSYWNIVKWLRSGMGEWNWLLQSISFTLIGVINWRITHGFRSA